MSVRAADIDHALGLFAGLGRITTRKMMGGVCFYHDGTIFAMMSADGTLRLKGAGDFVAALEAAGSTRWTYVRSNGVAGTMPYWSMPDAALDNPDLACDWARRALAHL